MRRVVGPFVGRHGAAHRLRVLTAGEAQALRLAHSRTAPARAVERARIIWAVHHGQGVGAAAAACVVDPETVRRWLERFSARGAAGLEDRPPCGREPIYSPEQVAEIIAAALTRPAGQGLPFAAWTLDRLVADLTEAKGVPMQRTRLGEVLRAEGLRWRKHETWFGERVDPAFAERRESSRSSRPTRRKAASTSASMRWGPSQRRASPDGSAPGSRPLGTARPSERARRSTTAGTARATSSARSGPRRARPRRRATHAGRRRAEPASSSGPMRGRRPPSGVCTRSSTA